MGGTSAAAMAPVITPVASVGCCMAAMISCRHILRSRIGDWPHMLDHLFVNGWVPYGCDALDSVIRLEYKGDKMVPAALLVFSFWCVQMRQ